MSTGTFAITALDQVQRAAPAGCESAARAARLTAAGVEVTWDDDLPGYRRFYVHDPWNNRLELLWPE